jgi:hypothetical protein
VTPLGGSCLFAGSRVSGIWAYLLPLAVMIATDPIVGHAGGASGGYTWTSPVIYGCFLINVWIGRRMLRSVTPIRVGGAAFICSLQFFVLTVFASWAIGVARHSPFAAPGFAGLMSNYLAALPFWGRTLAGDLLFSGALFGMYELLSRHRANAGEPAAA